MKYDKIHLVYFSPTHTSAKIAHALAEGTGIADVVCTDLTCEPLPGEVKIENALTVLAAPVYGGRIAETAMERFACLTGINAPVVTLALYGNRDYEDALLELTDLSRRAGFTPVAAGAFIGEHSYSRPDEGMPLAQGRPDADDCARAAAFGKKVMEKLEGITSLNNVTALEVKGQYPYKVKGPSTPAAPMTNREECTVCEHCVEICPTAAIYVSEEGEIESDKMRCIKCCACVKECPQSARVFDTPYTAMLFNNFKARREPEVFI